MSPRERSIQDLQDELQILRKGVRRPPTTSKEADYTGQPGDLRLVKDANGQYHIQTRFKDGWIMSIDDLFVVTDKVAGGGTDNPFVAGAAFAQEVFINDTEEIQNEFQLKAQPLDKTIDIMLNGVNLVSNDYELNGDVLVLIIGLEPGDVLQVHYIKEA